MKKGKWKRISIVYYDSYKRKKYTRSVQEVSIHLLWKRNLLKKIQETLYIGQWRLRCPFKVGTFVLHTVLPESLPLFKTLCKVLCWNRHQLSYFPESHWQSEISSLSKVILVLGKARSRRAPNLGCRGLSHLGDLMFHQKTEWVCCHDEAANHSLHSPRKPFESFK